MNKKVLYNSFHKVTLEQKFVIDENNYTYGEILKLIQKHLEGVNSILDIGCGTGSLSFFLLAKEYSVEGIDISNRAIRACQRDANKFGFKNYNFESTTLENFEPKKKYDLVILSEVIEHLDNDQEALVKIEKLLNKNGILILTTPSKNAPLYRMKLLDNFDKRVGHLRRYDKKTLSSLLNKTNFKILVIKEREGILRNFIYTNQIGGLILRIINRSKVLASVFISLDNFLIPIFGFSNFHIVAQKR